MEFHISRTARDRYHFDQGLFALSGNVIFANFQAVRQFAYQIHIHRERHGAAGREVKAGEINAMGMIDEILHLVIELYRRDVDAQVLQKALRYLNTQYGQRQVDKALLHFIDEFPSIPVYRGILDKKTYLKGVSGGRTNREIVLEEMLLLWMANVNPAFSLYDEFFDDSGLKQHTAYLEFIDTLFSFFEKQPFYGPDHQNLLVMLRAPAVAAPHSLQGQLEYIRRRWADLLGDYLKRLLGSLDFLSEQEKAFIPGGPGPSRVYRFGHLDDEIEMFSRDSDWMPNCVLIAKNTYVWLDQLSRRYQRPINRLDQIPDEELERLAHMGINGLWLIGLWERSRASQRIKQLCGNPDAVASAYSLAAYEIASDLGGEPAYQTLRDQASRFGLRLASDMVPNHMGLDSSWVIDHPDWFLSLDQSPFPAYSFNGQDLSGDGRVGLFIEDHYYSRNDAAVVFKRIDRSTGHERFIYHGNDGTNMPWNDTAQLDYLNPQVREAVIQTILAVARRFPIIRFDAAMTLAKKHYQRLWFPEPGSGGAIPTRAEHGLAKADFDRLMPREFWREVVDRVAREVPDTLLLAEAFWMMEGFFVRSLGMHRVYNSAFMHMLRDEDNASYRQLIKNTLEYDSQILKRYVNFMNNPDEKTAVEQFGKGDKYFGICTLMASMPGLPMFGHGQLEGFGEKYGMEYRRALLDEGIDEALVERHWREISPLLHRRRLFSEVENFLLYDFYADGGGVNEDVFAFSNRLGEERGLVLYNNRFNHTSGWIKRSAAFLRITAKTKRMIQKDLGEGLALGRHSNQFVIFRDQNANLEYIHSCQSIHQQGLHFELGAYQTRVLLDFREVTSTGAQDYARLAAHLGGRGVASIESALVEMNLMPILNPFRAISNPETLRNLLNLRAAKTPGGRPVKIPRHLAGDLHIFLQAAGEWLGNTATVKESAAAGTRRLEMLLNLPSLHTTHAIPATRSLKTGLKFLASLPLSSEPDWLGLIHWIYLHPLVDLVGQAHLSARLDEWHIPQVMRSVFLSMGMDPETTSLTQRLVTGMLTIRKERHTRVSEPLEALFQHIFQDPNLGSFLMVNRYNDILWFNHEAFQRLTWWLAITDILETIIHTSTEADMVERIIQVHPMIQKLVRIEKSSGCQVDRMLELLAKEKITYL
ncbi:MAG: alpha-amylase [Anaerolineaceae bacterium]|nr:alpha-amylase [Anaerolineaceae bacterium]